MQTKSGAEVTGSNPVTTGKGVTLVSEHVGGHDDDDCYHHDDDNCSHLTGSLMHYHHNCGRSHLRVRCSTTMLVVDAVRFGIAPTS